MVLAVESTSILVTNRSEVYLQSCLYVQFQIPLVTALPGKGGDSAYERGGDARRKF